MNKNPSTINKSIFMRFIIIFFSLLLVFIIVLVPLLIYCKNVFTELEIEKSSQQLNSGVSLMENHISGILSVPEVLNDDPRFIPLRYYNPDYDSVDINIRNQLRSLFNGIISPLSLITYAALQFDENGVINTHTVFFDDYFEYYPKFFCVDDLSKEEWLNLLSQNESGFLSVHHITTKQKSYDALIFSTAWSNSCYIYTCMNVEDVKRAFIAEQDTGNCYITISHRGEILYSDLPENVKSYHSINKNTDTGNLNIQIHLTQNVISEKMKPLYFFLIAYLLVCFIILLAAIYTGIKASATPILKIIRTLEASKNVFRINESEKDTSNKKNIKNAINYGFEFIQENIKYADERIQRYQDTLSVQHKMLQTRFLEKAISGQLISEKDRTIFKSYFPEFPNDYYLVQLKLSIRNNDAGIIYPDALSALSTFLQCELKNINLHRLNDCELLIIINAADYTTYLEVLNFMIENVNRTETAYEVRCVASQPHSHLESLPAAYSQLQALFGFDFPDCHTRVCSSSDCFHVIDNAIHIEELFTLYTAVTYGNFEIAIMNLLNYKSDLQNGNRHIYEMLRSLLICIKTEHPISLMSIPVPQYRTDIDLYEVLENIIIQFCTIINAENSTEIDSFVQDLIKYIDEHYTEYELNILTLQEVFNRSSSTIRKAFKINMGITITDYIEQKRMQLANILIAKKEKTVEEIAQSCGFANSNSFYKAYKRVYGHAPGTSKNTGK